MSSTMTTQTFGATTFTTPSDRELLATCAFDAPRELIFDAWTDPEHVPHWMIGPGDWTMPVCEIDLRPGGAWRFEWRGKDGAMEMNGEYKEIARPDRLISTENWGGDWPQTLNTLQLTTENGQTVARCTVRYPSREARDKAIATGMLQGWAASHDKLAEFLRTIL